MVKALRQVFLFLALIILVTSQGCQPAAPTGLPDPLPTPDAMMQSSPAPTPTLIVPDPSPTFTSQLTLTVQGEELDFRNIFEIALAADPGQSGTLYAFVNESKVYQSQDGGAIWKQLNETEIKQIPPLMLHAFLQTDTISYLRNILLPNQATILLTIDPATPANYYAIDDTAGGLIASIDGGKSWLSPVQLPTMVPFGVLAADPATSGHLFLSTISGFYFSEDGGKTWGDVSRAVREPGPSGLNFTQIIFHPRAANTIYLTGPNEYTYVSTDGGVNWREIRLPEVNNFYQGIGGIFIDPYAEQRFYVINNFQPPDLRVYLTENNGSDWAETTWNLPSGILRSLVIDPQNAMTFYAILDSGELSGFYRSTDGGQNWQEIEARTAQ